MSMQKLTKEQASALRAIFAKEFAYIDSVRPFTPKDISKIIDDCTENLFPEFTLELYGQTEIEKFQAPDVIKITQSGFDHTAPVLLTYTDVCSEEWEILIPPDKFKEFTEGCNKIVEWLDEY